ncbi:MAG: FAD:protein FMN transferase [Planctomycetes bacterium]|nr:FAD:protein FMN transferase [Planctomycetota bacterium]
MLTAAGDDAALQRHEASQLHMGVTFKLVFYAPDEQTANAAADAAFARIAELNQVMSDYDPASELSRLCDTAGSGQTVPISADLMGVLAISQDLARRTDGAFDVTVGPLVRLWRRARRMKEMPSDKRLAEARAATGFRHLELDPARGTAKLLRPGMQLDLGGIGQGYAADEALKVLRERGIARALVDASGDIAVGDPPPGKSGWRIGVAPLDKSDLSPSRYLLLSNIGVSTSGDAFQYVELGGKRYSHIVDPRTGLGLTDRSSVTVIAPDATAADSLATAVSVLGPEAGLKLIEATPGTAALIVRPHDDQQEVFESAQWRRFERRD